MFCLTAIHIGVNYALSRTTFAQKARKIPTRPKRVPYSFDFQERAVEYAAMFILISVFLYFVGYEVVVLVTQSGSAVAGAYRIARAGLFGAIGLIAGGAFRNDKDVGAKESARQAESLRMARLALDASDTAMTLTDPHRAILWCNPTFLQLAGAVAESDVRHSLLEVALSLSADNARTLHGCFRHGLGSEVDLPIRGFIVRVRVSPSTDSQISNGFVVVLKDVTEERSLEQFIASTLQFSHSTTQARNDVMHSRAQHVLAIDGLVAMSSRIDDKKKGQ
jgi:PAS domain-containing protein